MVYSLVSFIKTTMKVIIAVLFLFAAVSAGTPRFEQCARNPVAQIRVSQFPNPLYLRPNSRFRAAFTTYLSRELPEPTYVKVEMKKKVVFFYVGVPCNNNFGSCEYTVTCDQLRKWSGKDTLDEPCPPQAGSSTRTIDYPLPDISPSLRSMAKGEYEIKISLRTQPRGRGQLLGCIKTKINVRT